MRNAYCVLVGKPEGKRPLGRPRNREENGVEQDGSVECIHLAQDRDQWKGACEHGNKPQVSIKRFEILEQLSDRWLLK
jgi:hypothetical protein